MGQAARIASARGARLAQADGVSTALMRARAEGFDLILCDVLHDVGWLVQSLDAERIACPVVACGRHADASAAVRAIQAGAKEFLPLPPEPDLIAAMLQAAAGEADAPMYRDAAMAALLLRGRGRGAGRGVRPHHRRERHRQGGAGPPHPSHFAAAPTALSWR